MTVFFIFSLIIALVYASVIVGYYLSWKNYPAFTSKYKSNTFLFISVIIPVRNESSNIQFILNDLLQQDYDKEKFEILLVNDHSEDNTVKLATACKLSNLQILNLQDQAHGKKQAIKYGVYNSKGSLIVTIDGDCRLKPGWLSAISSFYNEVKPELIIGTVVYSEEKTVFDYMQSLEVSALVASGAAAAIQHKPVMCNGANLAFTKELYLKSSSELQSDIPSGDDIFLLQAAKKNKNDKISYLKSLDSAVFAKPAPDLKSFYQQRKRWTSKWVHYKDNNVLMLAFLVFLTNILICLSFFACFFNIQFIILFFALLAIKSTVDVLLLNSFTAFFEKKNIMRYFWLTQLIYPFYIVLTAFFSNLGKIEWKKRIY